VFLQQQHREQQRERGLRLQHQRREAGRHACRHAREQQPELEDRERQRHQRDPPPRHAGGAQEEDRGHGRDEEPQCREQQRREVREADLDDDEVHAPHGGEPEREQQVAGRHAVHSRPVEGEAQVTCS
jgi:hypothetical protein